MYANTYKGYWPIAVHDAIASAPTRCRFRRAALSGGRTASSRSWPARRACPSTRTPEIFTKLPNDQLRDSSVLWGCPAYILQDGVNNINLVNQQVRIGLRDESVSDAARRHRHRHARRRAATGPITVAPFGAATSRKPSGRPSTAKQWVTVARTAC